MQRNLKKRQGKVGDTDGGGNALQKWKRRSVLMGCGKTASETKESNRIPKTKHSSIVETHESTRERLESTLPKDHEDHVAGKGFNSVSHYNLVHKFIPMPPATKIPGCESRSGQGMEEARKVASLAIEQGKEQKGGYSGSTKREKKKVIDGHLSSQKVRSQNQSIKSTKDESCSEVTS